MEKLKDISFKTVVNKIALVRESAGQELSYKVLSSKKRSKTAIRDNCPKSFFLLNCESRPSFAWQSLFCDTIFYAFLRYIYQEIWRIELKHETFRLFHTIKLKAESIYGSRFKNKRRIMTL